MSMLGAWEALQRVARCHQAAQTRGGEAALDLIATIRTGIRPDACHYALLNAPEMVELRAITAALYQESETLKDAVEVLSRQTRLEPDIAMLAFDAAIAHGDLAAGEWLAPFASRHAPQAEFVNRLLAAARHLREQVPGYGRCGEDARLLDPATALESIVRVPRHGAYILCRGVQWNACADINDLLQALTWIGRTGLPFERRRLLFTMPRDAQPAQILQLACELINPCRAAPLAPLVQLAGTALSDEAWFTIARFAQASASPELLNALPKNTRVTDVWADGARPKTICPEAPQPTNPFAESGPKIAVCISGQMRSFEHAAAQLAVQLQGIDADIFVSTWQLRGTRGTRNLQYSQLRRLLPDALVDVIPMSWIERDGFLSNVPELAESLCEQRGELLRPAAIAEHYSATEITVQSDEEFLARHRDTIDSNLGMWRMYYKVHHAFELAKAHAARNGFSYDIFIRLRPDYLILRDDLEPWLNISDDEIAIDSVYSYGFGDQFAIARQDAMEAYASLWHRRSDYVEPGKSRLLARAPFLHFMETHKLLAVHCWLRGLRVRGIGANARLVTQPADSRALALALFDRPPGTLPESVRDWAKSVIKS